MSRSKVIAILLMSFLNDVHLSCYWNNYNPYRLFSTKTPYINGRDCKALSVWGLFRHGQRTPGVKYSASIKDAIAIREDIIAKHKEGKGSLCVQDVENLRNWEVNQAMFENLHDTTEDGLFEMTEIGHRFKEAFKDLLGNLEPDTYTFISNKDQYIRICVDSFLRGLEQTDLKVDDMRKGDVTAPFDDCKIYAKVVKHNQTTFAQAQKYLLSTEYLTSKYRVQKRLGLTYELSNGNLTALYDLCRYTWSTAENKPSPWCALFDEDDLKIQEYYEDLRLYYRNGYGNQWNVEFGQIPLADLFKTFRSEKENPHKKITAYFSHATMLSMAYSALGLFMDDKPLTADYRNEYRKWRTSEHAPFGGTLVAVLNKCNKIAPDDYVVAFYMNEKPLDAICNHGVCSWKEFEEKLKPTENKTFENVCYKKI